MLKSGLPKLLLRITLFTLLLGVINSCGSSKRTAATKTVKGEEENGASDILKEYAEILEVKRKDLNSPELYRFVDHWEGTPYEYGGQSMSGIDCSGFINKLYDEVYGIDLPRMVEDIYKSCDKRFRRKRKLEEGDLVFFDIKRGKKASHIGVYLQNDKFVHASSSRGVLISDLENPYYQKHFHKGGRCR